MDDSGCDNYIELEPIELINLKTVKICAVDGTCYEIRKHLAMNLEFISSLMRFKDTLGSEVTNVNLDIEKGDVLDLIVSFIENEKSGLSRIASLSIQYSIQLYIEAHKIIYSELMDAMEKRIFFYYIDAEAERLIEFFKLAYHYPQLEGISKRIYSEQSLHILHEAIFESQCLSSWSSLTILNDDCIRLVNENAYFLPEPLLVYLDESTYDNIIYLDIQNVVFFLEVNELLTRVLDIIGTANFHGIVPDIHLTVFLLNEETVASLISLIDLNIIKVSTLELDFFDSMIEFGSLQVLLSHLKDLKNLKITSLKEQVMASLINYFKLCPGQLTALEVRGFHTDTTELWQAVSNTNIDTLTLIHFQNAAELEPLIFSKIKKLSLHYPGMISFTKLFDVVKESKIKDLKLSRASIYEDAMDQLISNIIKRDANTPIKRLELELPETSVDVRHMLYSATKANSWHTSFTANYAAKKHLNSDTNQIKAFLEGTDFSTVLHK